MLALVEDHLLRARKAHTDGDILEILSSAAQAFGFRGAGVSEFVGDARLAQSLIDTDPCLASQRHAVVARALFDNHPAGAATLSASVLRLDATRFDGADAAFSDAAEHCDLVACVIVPIGYGGEIVGAAAFSGAPPLTGPAALALQMVCYSLFAQLRAFRSRPAKPGLAVLSPRERQVMRLSAEGLTAQAIGERLGISARTANQHADNAAEKLGTRNRIHTVAEAIRHDLI